MVPLPMDEVLSRLEGNDPTLRYLDLDSEYVVNDPDEVTDSMDEVFDSTLGRLIGQNTILRELRIDRDVYSMEDRNRHREFFRGMSQNRSIKRLSFAFVDEGDLGKELFGMLIPFFGSNCLEALKITCWDSRDTPYPQAFAEFSSLKELELCGFRASQTSDIIQALHGHSGLETLRLSSILGLSAVHALVSLLQKANSKLAALEISDDTDLEENALNNDELANLAAGLAGNRSLKELDLSFLRGVTPSGWMSFFAMLSTEHWSKLEELSLRYNAIDDTVLASLANALRCNTSLKCLHLAGNNLVTATGWVSFVAIFNTQHLPKLETLGLRFSDIDDAALTSFANALRYNPYLNLKYLDLSSIGATATGWMSFVAIFNTQHLPKLETLDLRKNAVDDAVLISLANALRYNTNLNLKTLGLSQSSQVTATGWASFLSLLNTQPRSTLRNLDLSGNTVIDDSTLISFASALRCNTSLMRLVLSTIRGITDTGLNAFTRLLCDTTSIEATDRSNHTLEIIEYSYCGSMPHDLRALLQLNRDHSNVEASRLKVVNTHFGDDFGVLMEMKLEALPHAIAWVGMGGSNHQDDGLLGQSGADPELLDFAYRFIQTRPDLFAAHRSGPRRSNDGPHESPDNQKLREENGKLRARIRYLEAMMHVRD